MKSVCNYFLFCLFVLLLFGSCRKKTQETDSDTSSASENFLATSIGNDMGNVADEAGRTKNISSFKASGSTGILSSCASIQFDTLVNVNADTITVNFGNSNCLCNDGRYRRGSLVIVYNGRYRDSLTTVFISPKNYFVNDNGVSGSKTVKNLGHNSQGHLVYDISETISIVKADNSGSIVLNALRKREWVSGENTVSWLDDKYSITGSATGSNANGRNFTSVITKPLIRDMSIACRKHFISGIMQHTPVNKPTRTIDFGDETCDNKATVTINNKVYEITLP
ncbi:MAG: hypothetical protein JWO32_2727 [Bacteroidetes bacterium]|nr:hypothetical protein [Bacteroidota bacterium]